MQHPSLRHIVSQARETFTRFPLAILSSFAFACIGVYLIDSDAKISEDIPYVNALRTFSLGIPLYCVVYFFCIKNNSRGITKIVGIIGATLLLLIIYLSFPTTYTTYDSLFPDIRYTILGITILLSLSFLPYINSKSVHGFWNYNKLLFLRFFTSVLYSIVLCVGIEFPLTILDTLFDLPIKVELYQQVLIVVAGTFSTWFFLAGIPKELDNLETLKHPKKLRLFVQFVLLPLLTLYLVILYAYGIKILIQGDWPKGVVAYLVIWMACFGTLTFLLIYPYKDQKESVWIRKFTKNYFYFLLPLIALLFVAISIRIELYGITVNRSIIVLLGVWLTIVTGYFSFAKNPIRFIPMSLTVMLIVASFGPWSIFSISEKNQITRLKDILENNLILIEGSVQNETVWPPLKKQSFIFSSEKENKNDSLLTDSLKNEVISILTYLDDTHGLTQIKSWFSQSMDSIINELFSAQDYVNEALVYTKTLGLSYEYPHANTDVTSYFFNSSSLQNKPIDVSKYDYFFSFSGSLEDSKNNTILLLNDISYTLMFSNKIGSEIQLANENEIIKIGLRSLYKRENHGANFTIVKNVKNYRIRFDLLYASIKKMADTTQVEGYIEGRLFFQKKK